MNKIRPLILALSVVAAALLSYYIVPALGSFDFTRTVYVIVNVVIFLLFLILFGLEGVRGRLNAKRVFTKSMYVLLSALGFMSVGTFISYVCSSIAGVPFKLFGILQGISFDTVTMIIALVVMLIISAVIYLAARAKAVRSSASSMRQSASVNAVRNQAYSVLYAVLALMFILSAALLLANRENVMLIIPLSSATLAMMLYHLTGLRLWIPVSIIIILMHAFSFYYVMANTMTIGALGIVMMLSFLVIMLIIPMADIYMLPSRKK